MIWVGLLFLVGLVVLFFGGATWLVQRMAEAESKDVTRGWPGDY